MVTQEPIQIRTYEDLIIAKQFLKSEIEQQEAKFKDNPVFKISSSLMKGNLISGSKKSPLSAISSLSSSALSGNYLKTAENLLSTFLLANKKTRSMYVGFIIAKEMIPFTLQKINEALKRK